MTSTSTSQEQEDGTGARHESSLLYIGFLAAVVLAVFWRHLFGGYSFPHDYLATSRWPVFITNTLGGGHFTEWIPFAGGGQPLPYNAASGLYFPVWWVMGWLRIPATLPVVNFVQAAHVFLGASGVFVLGRTIGLDRRWALIGGTAFVFFGGNYSNGFHDLIVRGHAYAPWLLWTLTPPQKDKGWLRVIGLPFWIWLLVSGGYPGQAMAFLQVGTVYLAVHLWIARKRFREFLVSLVSAFAGSLAVFATVYLPSFLATRAGELYRPFPPTATERAIFSFHAKDVFGLYLNPFAWDTPVALMTGWAVGVVALVGLAGISRTELYRNLPLMIAGFLAFLLAFLPSWLPAGRVMASFPLLFPSRLVASDNKAMIAVPLVLLSAMGWSRISAGSARRPFPVALGVGILLIGGLALAPQTTAIAPARIPWLVTLIVVLAVGIVLLRSRLQPRIVFLAVLLLTLAEGSRVIVEMEIFPGVSTWALPPDLVPERALHDSQAYSLRKQFDRPPERRPARIPEVDVNNAIYGGHPNDGLAYLGTTYSLGDFSSFITTARRNIILNPQLRAVMLKPWTAWVWSCEEMDCSGRKIDVPEFGGRESDRVRTTSYGLSKIRYRVSLSDRSMMIENETFARGWDADRSDIIPVSVDGTLRGWVLPAGNYEFTASYVLPERKMQLGLAALALGAWAFSVLAYRRSKGASPQPAMDL